MPDLLSVPFGAEHDVSTFACGVSELDDWLRRVALNSDAAGNSRTWVWAPDGTDVVAYYALSPHIVASDDIPRRLARGALRKIPSILLARLALAERLQGRGLGSALLADALTRILGAIKMVGGRLIVVDAVNEQAARFYEHHGFVRTSNEPARLVIKANRVETSG